MRKLTKRILLMVMCATMVLSVPMVANASPLMSKDSAIASVRRVEKMEKTGYLQCDLNFRALPSLDSKVLLTGKKNAKIKYRKYGDNWVIAVYKGQIGFFRSKYVGKKKVAVKKAKTESVATKKIYAASYFRRMGVIHWNGWRWTWYSEKVLPGGGLKIPGRHVNEDGYVSDENGYICLASSTLNKGTIVSTPFGHKGKVYDDGCNSNTLDVYVSW